jgi:hypothetical protein
VSQRSIDHSPAPGPPSGLAATSGPGSQYPREAFQELRVWERLGEDVGMLTGDVDLDEPNLLVPDHFMGEVLTDIDVLGTLASADHVVSPLDARRVVLVHRRDGLLGEALWPSRSRRSTMSKQSTVRISCASWT